MGETMGETTTSYTTGAACAWCGKYHGTRCPEVKAIEYHPDGSVKRVEFVTQADFHPLDPIFMPVGYPAHNT